MSTFQLQILQRELGYNYRTVQTADFDSITTATRTARRIIENNPCYTTWELRRHAKPLEVYLLFGDKVLQSFFSEVRHVLSIGKRGY